MSLLTIPEYDFSTESDVEQKFIMSLLTHPSFLEVPFIEYQAVLRYRKSEVPCLDLESKREFLKTHIEKVVFAHGKLAIV